MERTYTNLGLGLVVSTLGNLLMTISAGAVQVIRDRPPEFEINIFR